MLIILNRWSVTPGETPAELQLTVRDQLTT